MACRAIELSRFMPFHDSSLMRIIFNIYPYYLMSSPSQFLLYTAITRIPHTHTRTQTPIFNTKMIILLESVIVY